MYSRTSVCISTRQAGRRRATAAVAAATSMRGWEDCKKAEGNHSSSFSCLTPPKKQVRPSSPPIRKHARDPCPPHPPRAFNQHQRLPGRSRFETTKKGARSRPHALSLLSSGPRTHPLTHTHFPFPSQITPTRPDSHPGFTQARTCKPRSRARVNKTGKRQTHTKCVASPWRPSSRCSLPAPLPAPPTLQRATTWPSTRT